MCLQLILVLSPQTLVFTNTATTEIYTLSLHDALPISVRADRRVGQHGLVLAAHDRGGGVALRLVLRSEEHTSELQSLRHLVCRLLLEKKKRHRPDRMMLGSLSVVHSV